MKTKQLINELLKYPMDLEWEVYDAENGHAPDPFVGLICNDKDNYAVHEINFIENQSEKDYEFRNIFKDASPQDIVDAFTVSNGNCVYIVKLIGEPIPKVFTESEQLKEYVLLNPDLIGVEYIQGAAK